ncbi:MAG: NAD(P)H-hydrate dehydratase [Clostridiales bacterium]|nr:NAD(P)H-hydrate dehydratase [Clostridiales bacterium]
MRFLLTPEQMSDMERRFFEATGMPSIDLMERAASEVVKVLVERFGSDKTVFFACGPGGNGGDGLAAARLYREAGGNAAFALSEPPRSADAKENHRRAIEAGVREIAPDSDGEPDIWVDALFGTGFSRAPEGTAEALIQRINRSRILRDCPVVSVDIPSGLSGLTGEAPGAAVWADITIAFQYAKLGHYLNDGLDASGEVVVRDIGIPSIHLSPGDPVILASPAKADASHFPRNTHKGERGHVLVVAGSLGMAGAAALAAGAALRSGAGLVTVACPRCIVPVLQSLEPCAICAPLPERGGALSRDAVEPLKALFAGKRALVVGCGLSRRCAPEIVEAALESGLPAVVDADALNILSEHRELLQKLRPHHALTPHPGEAERLLGRALSDPASDVRALASLGCAAILKGASRLIATSGRPPVLSATGCAGMAKGGSGDVFAGMLGAHLARPLANLGKPYSMAFWTPVPPDVSRRMDAMDLALVAELHGLAGLIAERRIGSEGMTAQDIVAAIPEVFRSDGD